MLGGLLVGRRCAAIGLIVSHVRDVYFLMITLAIGMVLWGLSYRWIPVTGGDNGLSGIPVGWRTPACRWAGAVPFYYVALAVLLAVPGDGDARAIAVRADAARHS